MLLPLQGASIAQSAVGHNCALDKVHGVDISDDGHSGPVVGEVALAVGVPLAEDHSSQATGFSGEAEPADAGEEADVGEFIGHIPISCSVGISCAVRGEAASGSSSRSGRWASKKRIRALS